MLVLNDTATTILKNGRIPWELPSGGHLDHGAAAVGIRAGAVHMHHTGPRRFTLDGSEALEQHLVLVCARVAAEVAQLIPAGQLEGLLLAGGYGRGEGGVLRDASGDRPYNDLEFYVFVRGNLFLAERRYRAALHALGARLSPEAGLEVEFKLLTLDKLRRSAPSMFYYDLVLGRRWLVGDDSLLAGCAKHCDSRTIPLHEATRLLMNRCSGLLFSAERLRRESFGPDEADFVGRNLAKAKLAFGDVLLTAHGQYHWSCRERHERLARLEASGATAPFKAVRHHHAAGVAFKLHPVRSAEPHAALARRHAELSELGNQLWLWLENRRLDAAFATTRAYALSRADKCPETSPHRNRLVNARAFGLGAALAPAGAAYPRQRLLHALCLLLWEQSPPADATLLRRVQRELHTRATSFAGLVAAYEQLWQRFN